MLHFAGRIAFSMDVGKFLELQGAFQCQGPGKTAPEIEEIFAGRIFYGQFLGADTHFGQDIVKQGRQITQNRDLFPRFPLLHAALAQSPGNRHQGQGQHLTGHGLGGGHADFRASLGKDHRARFPRY